MVKPCNDLPRPDWLLLRRQLWPDCPESEHLAEMEAFLAEPRRFGQFMAYDDAGAPVGLVEVAIRTDYVNGADTTPVAFLEGIYVAPNARRSGVARKLVAEAERWSLALGCTELASDAAMENTASHAMHAALGFLETERVVFFKKVLQ